jgi:hypothetical protein
MNDTMIEAISQLGIPRPIPGPDDTVRCRARAGRGPCASSAVSTDTACNTLTVATVLRGGVEAR